MAGHGAQKLFGLFGGHGLKGTAGWLESMNLRPGTLWAALAGGSEFGGGLLTALGFLNPVGSVGTVGAMAMATSKAHWGKPVWNTSGGAELPLVYSATALALGLARPGKFSVDEALGIRLPRRLILIPGLAVVAASVAYANLADRQARSAQEQPEAQAQEQQSSTATTQSHAEPQPESLNQVESMEAVPVPDSPAVNDMRERERAAEQNSNLVSGAELQSGESAEHPI
jgi:putative oxidoreductase